MESIFIIIAIFLSLSFVSITLSLWKIFEKEKVKEWFALIPFLNIYYYLKICKLPFWPVFIPFVNLIFLIFSSFRLAKQYQCSETICILSILFPFATFPYIAFSNSQNKDRKIEFNYLKNKKDIETLENKLVTENSDSYIKEEDLYDNIIESTSISSTEEALNKIEENVIVDDIIYDEANFNELSKIENNDKIEEINTPIDEFVEIIDEVPEKLTKETIDVLEKQNQQNNVIEKNIETNFQDFKEIGPSNEAIAFGGEQKIENIDAIKSKNEELKCNRCGSSLIGANGFCPGCGSKI